MVRDKRRSWRRALVAGLAIAAVPIIGLNALLAFNIVTASQAEVDGVAAEVLQIADARIDAAATALISLGLTGVADCRPQDVEALRRAAQRAGFGAEVAVTDAAGAGRCAAFGAPRVVRRTSPDHGTMNPDLTLSSVAIGETSPSQSIRLQWRYPSGQGARVLVPGEAIFPHFLKSRLTAAFSARLVMIDGTTVARTLVDPDLERRTSSVFPSVTAMAQSQRYPLRIDVEVRGAALARANGGLFIYANLGGLVFAIGVAVVAVLMNRRTGGPVREIADGIRRREFIPYYQPVIDIETGRLLGCEVMVRWRKSDGRIVQPGRFISLAEASGEIFPMTLVLMETARDEMAEAYARRPGLKLGFNLFAGHFEDVLIVDDVRRIFEGSPVRMSQLMFEVTERQPLPDMRRARLVIAKLQALGAKVALDDVGTGHGGLSYLLKLGVDVMKMDKMFVDAIGTDRYSVAIVDSLVKLADDMNLELIAEGVETFDQVQYLRAKGVRMAQGYVFAPPLPAKQFLALVEAMCPVGRRAADDTLRGAA